MLGAWRRFLQGHIGCSLYLWTWFWWSIVDVWGGSKRNNEVISAVLLRRGLQLSRTIVTLTLQALTNKARSCARR